MFDDVMYLGNIKLGFVEIKGCSYNLKVYLENIFFGGIEW